MAAVTRLDKPKAPYAERENLSFITRKGGERDSTSRVSGMTKKAATKQAKSDAEDGMDRNYEDMKTAYDNYKLSNAPSSKKLTERLRKGDITAEKPLSNALQAADDAYFATREEAHDKLRASTKPKPGEYDFKKGGAVKSKAKSVCMKSGGSVKSGASRGDGCAVKGKTRGRYC